MMSLLGIVGIILGITFLIYFAYKGISVMLIAPLAGMIVAVFNRLDPIINWREVFVPGIGNALGSMFGMTFLGTLVAGMYNASGGALSIANGFYSLFVRKGAGTESKELGPGPAIFCIMLIAVSLSYGGMSAFVISFVLFPIALELMKKARIPRVMAPGIVMGGLATAGLSMPGSPQMQNALPMRFLGTGPNAALIPGIIGGIVVLGLNFIMMTYLAKKEITKGNVYTDPPVALNRPKFEKTPHPLVAAIPLIVTVVMFSVFKIDIFYALVTGFVLSVILFWRFIGGWKNIITAIQTSLNPLGGLSLNAYSVAAFAAVIASVPAFQVMADGMIALPIGGLFKVFIVVAVLSGISGQGPVGITASLPMFSKTFAGMGINMSAMHRVAAFSATTLDTLPTNPAFIVSGDLVQVSVAQSYKYCGITTVLNTTIGTLVVCALLTLFPGLA